MSLAPGARLGHYEILSPIGAGGMGQVYRAHDTRLGRDIALKVLHQDVAADPTRLERFTREARAVAALNHPHIVTIFSTEEADGVRFLTMELVEGVPLGTVIPPQGLPGERVLQIGTELADAIAAAHDRGVTHRDLKPANVMLDAAGRVKILDFGLAKLAAVEGEFDRTHLDLTHDGLVVGTMPYMSPEQVEGKPIDHRTDIFSLGILLYEMATGERPFRGGSPAALMSELLRDAPPPVTVRRTDLPERLGEIIGRCLEKDPRDRYQTAREVQHQLDRLTRAPASGAPRGASSGAGAARPRDEALWIAVLPFKAHAGDPLVDALADGLTEDITTGLARFSYLHLVGRGSTLAYQGRAVDIRTVGKELGARYVMEGSVRKVASTVRISAQLIDAATGGALWAETYTRDLAAADVFALQDDVAGKIVATAADSYGVLTRAMGLVARGKAVTSPYEAVLRGLGYWQVLTADEHREVRDGLERAVEQAPEYADAWASLALMYIEEHKHGFNPRPDPFGRALAAVRRALALDAFNQFGYHALAQASFFQHDLSAFRLAAERAMSLNPLDGSTVAYMGILVAYSGDWERGVAIADRAMSLNPHPPGWYRFAAFYNCYRKGEDADALDIAERLRMGMPAYYYSYLALAVAHAQLGHVDAARAAAREIVTLVPDFVTTIHHKMAQWQHWNPDLRARIVDGLRKAGLDIPDAASAV
jgi:TolB-like protein